MLAPAACRYRSPTSCITASPAPEERTAEVCYSSKNTGSNYRRSDNIGRTTSGGATPVVLAALPDSTRLWDRLFISPTSRVTQRIAL